MNNSGNRESDTADRYIVRGKIEKAPEGFTERVMMQVRMENDMVSSYQRSGNMKIIPVVAFITALVLIILAWMTTSTGSMFLDSASQLLKNVNNWLPDMNIKNIPGIDFPVILLYISSGIFILALFDLALNRLFNYREKR